MGRDEVMRWVAKYEQAWRAGDLAGVEQLFTAEANYRPSPYADSEVGHDAIKAFWRDDEDQVFTVRAEPIAVEDRQAVRARRGSVRRPGSPGVSGSVGASIRRTTAGG